MQVLGMRNYHMFMWRHLNKFVIMLYLAGIVITFFLAIILLSKRNKTVADLVLAAWLCIMGFHLFLFYWHITRESYNHPYVLGVGVPMPLLHGPLLYIYTLTVTRDNKFSKKYWLHFIPALLAYIGLYDFFILTNNEKINVYENEGAGFEIHTSIILIAIIISGFTYVSLSFYELRKYKKKISDQFSNTEKINLNWLRYLIYGILAIWVVVLLNGGDALIFATVVVFVFLLGYFGIKHVGIFSHQPIVADNKIQNRAASPLTPAATNNYLVPEEMQDEAAPAVAMPTAVEDDEALTAAPKEIDPQSLRTKYERSGLQKEAADKIHEDLNLLMQSEKLFKNEELSLAQLAGRLQVHANNLSQVINTYEQKNFYDYINTLRIKEFQNIVTKEENQRYTLLSLAFECGFNSKTAFNRNFKKFTGQSPSAYLKDINVQLQ